MIDKKEILSETLKGSAVKPKPLPQQKSAGLNDPYAKELTPSPSGSTNPGSGVQFSRPRPTGATGAVAKKNNDITNYRTLGTVSGQIGAKTLPKQNGQKYAFTLPGVKTSSPSKSLNKQTLKDTVRKSIPGATPKPANAFPNGEKSKTVGNTQSTI